jgi:malate dehydrogenase
MPRVVIVGGGGGVGASLAFNLLLAAGDYEVVLVDERSEMVSSHVLDLEQVLEQGATGSIRGGSDADIAGADILVIGAATALTVNDSRMVYLHANARIVASVLERVPEGWGGVLVIFTNPVDPLCTFAQVMTGIDRRRVLGYTLNDTLRLRTGVARSLGIEPARVSAWSLGEHGPLAVHLLDRVRVDGEPVELTTAQRTQAVEFVGNWYLRHVGLDSGRSSTWTSGLGLARMLAAIGSGDHEPWPASVMLAGEYGIDGVSVSVPVSLGPGGAERIHEWELTGDQRRALDAAARYIREAAEAIGARGAVA